jgi:hypothetical protein
MPAAFAAAPGRLGDERLAHQEAATAMPSGHAYSSAYTVSTFSLSSSRIILCSPRDLVDAGLAVLGAHDRAARGLRDARQLRLAFRRELGRQRLSVVVAPDAVDLAVRADVGDHLRRPASNLHDVDARPFLGAAVGDRRRIALEILAVGHEDDHPTWSLRLRIAREDLARRSRARAVAVPPTGMSFGSS